MQIIPEGYAGLTHIMYKLHISTRHLGEAIGHISSLIEAGDPDFKGQFVPYGKGYAVSDSAHMQASIEAKLKEAGLCHVRMERIQGISPERYKKIMSIATVDPAAALQGISDSPLWLRR